MHAKTTVAALLLAAFAGSALADDPTIVNDQFAGSRTRAEVNAELAAYRAAGVNPWANSYQPLKYFRSATSREAVVADYLASRNEVRALTGEDSGSAYLAQARGVLPVQHAGRHARQRPVSATGGRPRPPPSRVGFPGQRMIPCCTPHKGPP